MELPGRRAVIAVIHDGSKFLAIKRSAHVRAPGKICFPGGQIEPNEAEPEALMRELREELDVAIQPSRKLWQCDSNYGVELNWWTATLGLNPRFQPNWLEVEAWYWMSHQELQACEELLPSNRLFLDAIDRGILTLDPST